MPALASTCLRNGLNKADGNWIEAELESKMEYALPF